MKSIKDDILYIKKELTNMENVGNVDQDLYKLLDQKDIDPTLHRLLILLHSNYKADLNVIKNTSIKNTVKILDNLILIIDNIDNRRLEVDNKILHKEQTNTDNKSTLGKTNILEFNVFQKTILTGVLAIGFLMFMAWLSPTALNTAVGIFGRIFGGYMPPPQEVLVKQATEYENSINNKDNVFLQQTLNTEKKVE